MMYFEFKLSNSSFSPQKSIGVQAYQLFLTQPFH